MKVPVSYCLMVVFLAARVNGLFAQQSDTVPYKTEIVQDDRVELLVQKHIHVNQVSNAIDGFRIQIFSESGVNSKNMAQSVLDGFMARFPGKGAYLTFKSPNYRVRIGDFRTRLDAQRFLIELTTEYPNAFIISDQINLPQPD